MVSNSYRAFGNKKDVPQDYLFVLGWLFGLVNGSTRFIWGYLMDKFGFKILMVIISIMEMGIAGSIYFLVKYPILYVIENSLIACCLSGTFTTITPLFNKVFGKDFGAEMYGLTGLSIGIASFCGPLLVKAIIPDTISSDDDMKYYLYLYIAGGGICFIKFIILLFFKEDEQYIFSYITIKVDVNDMDERITRSTFTDANG